VFNLEIGICYSAKWFKLTSQWPDSVFYNDALVATYVRFLTTPMLHNYGCATYFSAQKKYQNH